MCVMTGEFPEGISFMFRIGQMREREDLCGISFEKFQRWISTRTEGDLPSSKGQSVSVA
jgi:hypothetical protein